MTATRVDWGKLLSEKRLPNPVARDEAKPDWLVASRLETERDVDRILFASPVRRLGDKTQVFPLERNEHVRNRLTHSHEVSNLARSIGTHLVHSPLGVRIVDEARKALGSGCDERVRRAIGAVLAATGLAHDLGNPPFGHRGENSIRSWFAGREGKIFTGSSEPCFVSADQREVARADIRKLGHAHRQDFLFFESNAQTLRTVTRLQVVKDHRGLNLTFGTLAALMKYTVGSDALIKSRGIGKLTGLAPGLESGEAEMKMPQPASYPRHRFPAGIISHAVWLYHLFSLSLRDVELILAERGVIVTHESIRSWCGKFGAEFAKRLRKRRPKPGDVWHLDEVFIRINGRLHYLWRAVDQHGVVLDILVQGRRNAEAAKRFFKRLLRGLQYKRRRLITDGLRSYGAAHRAIMPDVRHRTSRYLNNRAENSHGPTRRRERQMQKFKSPAQAQQFLSAHGMIYGHFRLRRHLMTAASYRRVRAKMFRSGDRRRSSNRTSDEAAARLFRLKAAPAR